MECVAEILVGALYEVLGFYSSEVQPAPNPAVEVDFLYAWDTGAAWCCGSCFLLYELDWILWLFLVVLTALLQ